MGQPKAGTPATIAQGQTERDSLFLVDGGDFFTQDDGSAHLDRRAIEWQRETAPGQWERVSPPAPTVKRTQWDERLPSEIDRVNGKWQSVLKIGPENAGRKFRALVMAGYGPSADAGKSWVEWGAESGDGSGRVVYSNTITVQPWGTTPPPPSDEEALVKAARDATRALVMHLRSEGLTWAQVKAHPFGHAYYTDLGGK